MWHIAAARAREQGEEEQAEALNTGLEAIAKLLSPAELHDALMRAVEWLSAHPTI